MSSRSSVIVTGGAGFIGSHLIRKVAPAVLEKGGKVISLDKRDPSNPVLGVDYVKADISSLTDVSIPTPVARLYHLAALSRTPGHEPQEYYETNVAGTIEIVRFAEQHDINTLFFTSTMSVYALGEDPKTEETLPEPINEYGHSKLIAEELLRHWLDRAEGRKLVITRPAVVFGSGENGNFTRLARLLGKGYFVYPGRRDTIKASVYVEDLIDWIEYAIDHCDRYTLFNSAYANSYTIQDIVQAFQSIAFKKTRSVTIPASALLFAATLLQGFSKSGMGIHPERVRKLMRSTNIVPKWATEQGLNTRDGLVDGIRRWRDDSGGTFV